MPVEENPTTPGNRERWRDRLAHHGALFDEAFLTSWGDELWEPNDADRKAAAELHVQLVSRITTQRLGYTDGVEATALKSVYDLFDKTRDITTRQFEGRHFDAFAWHVLNLHVRPFTAKWHRQSQRGALTALDATDLFRAELTDLQRVLSAFDDLLMEIRDGRSPPIQAGAVDGERERQIAAEMARRLEWGVSERLGGLDAAMAKQINDAERTAVVARRAHYQLAADTPHAIGLALSGGGIRSATFSLGVLVALARRNLLPQFDYLSTVSGGGYLGAFITTFLNSGAPAPDATPANTTPAAPATPAAPDTPAIGLRRNELPFRRDEGEAEALRHIRHYSKYLVTGSLWERTTMTCAQVYGMALNGLGIAYLGVVAALLELALRSVLGQYWLTATVLAAGVLALTSVVVLLLQRLIRSSERYADGFLAVPAVALLVLLAGQLLSWLHELYKEGVAATPSWPISISGVVIIAAAAIPLVASAVIGLLVRLPAPLRFVLTVLAAVAAPVFVLGIELVVYDFTTRDASAFHVWIVVGLAALATIILLIVLDINFTAPHRHYRKKLAEAYLIQPARRPEPGAPFETGVSLLLSKSADGRRCPYHIINCALNVPGSRNPAMQGRLTDFFIFSRAYCGSPLIGYAPTKDWESADHRLDLATAMAISGAAAAPQMGLGTMRHLSFWLALLNIRLSYWLKRPNKTLPWADAPGLPYLLQEMFGQMHEGGRFLNLSDGGHMENLGVYELLRRRCKYIVAVDGEHDPQMTFAALTTLQRLAFIDLGVTIDIDLDDLRLNARGMTRSHFSFCRIRYPKDTRDGEQDSGYLIYLKPSLTGNEGEFIRRYRLDEPSFPHHSTADQFFTEAQFEAYRSLGEHVGDKLFLPAIVGSIADSNEIKVEDWFLAIGRSMLEPIR